MADLQGDDGMPGRPAGSGPDRFERSVRFWLHAYPARWRAVRGEELLAVLRDLAAPQATRPSGREILGLVRAGWATRWRDGPPLRTRIGYGLGFSVIPTRYREWARDDIAGRWYGSRRLLWVLGWQVLFFWVLPMAIGGRPAAPWLWVTWLLIAVSSVGRDLLLPGSSLGRTQAMRRHLLPAPGEPPPRPGELVGSWAARPRVGARTGTALLVAVLGVGALVWGAASVAALRGPVRPVCAVEGVCVELPWLSWPGARWPTIVAVALMLGLAAGARAHRLIRRLIPDRPAQPARWVGAVPEQALMSLAIIGPLIGWQVWAEVDRGVAALSPVGALTCLVLLPGAVVAWRAARSGPADLAFVDLWRIGTRGRLPVVDAPVVTVVRWQGDQPSEAPTAHRDLQSPQPRPAAARGGETGARDPRTAP